VLPALILAAGLGTRLDPLTRMVAKAAVPLAGRTLIERVMAFLKDQTVTDIVINLHHLPETITSIVGDGSHLGVRVRYSWEREILGSAGGPRHALSLIDAPAFFILNGDTLSDIPLQPLVAAHRRTGAAVTLAVVPNPAPDHYNGLEVSDDGWVTGGRLKGDALGTWHFFGVQVVNREVFADLPDNVPAETIHGAYRALMGRKRGGLRAERMETSFLDVGTPRDYLEASLRLAHEQHWASAIDAGPGAVDSTASLTSCVVWPGARIGARATLRRAIVTGGVSVPADFDASGVLIAPASIVRPDDAVRVEGDLALYPLGPP
jgi:NDP-sugar pyrophosphorylase family protein